VVKLTSATPAAAVDRVVTAYTGKKTRQGDFGESVIANMLGAWGMGLTPGSWTANRVEQAQH
jgi:hypothetical protein